MIFFWWKKLFLSLISWLCIIGLWTDYDPRRIVVDRQYLRWENDHLYLLRSLSMIQSGRRWCRGRNELLLNTSSHWRVPCRLKVIVSRLTYDYGWIWITWTRTHSLTCKEKSVRKIWSSKLLQGKGRLDVALHPIFLCKSSQLLKSSNVLGLQGYKIVGQNSRRSYLP